jgi:hypothetical protein
MPPDPVQRPTEPNTQQMEVLRQALAQARCNLVIVCLMLAGVVAAGLYAYFAGGRWVESEEKRLMDATRKEVESHSETLVKEAGELAADSLPPFLEAFAVQMAEDLPSHLPALDHQANHLSADLTAHLKQKVKEQAHRQLARDRAILQEEFPEITDPKQLDQMMAALQHAVEQLAEHSYVEEFHNQAERMTRIWDSIEPAKPMQGGDRALERELVHSAQDWLLLKIRESEAAQQPAASTTAREEAHHD